MCQKKRSKIFSGSQKILNRFQQKMSELKANHPSFLCQELFFESIPKVWGYEKTLFPPTYLFVYKKLDLKHNEMNPSISFSKINRKSKIEI